MDTIKVLLLILCSGMLLTGCEKDETYSQAEQMTLTVASAVPADKEELYYWTAETFWKPRYIVKRGSDEWQLWPSWNFIRGFDEQYEPGYEYVIWIVHRVLAHPMEDQNSDEYTLLRIISKTRKDSENIPPIYLEE